MNDHFRLILSPLLPAPWLIAAAVLTALIILFAFYRRAKGSVLRGALFALVLLALANPSLVGEQREALKDKAIVIVDNTASTSLGDRRQQITDAAKAIDRKLAEMPDLETVTDYVVGNSETDLFGAVSDAMNKIPPDRLAGVIAITDGEVHDQPPDNLKAPFHTLLAGHQDEIDRRLIIKAAPAFGIVGQSVTVTLRVDDAPKAQSDKATVIIRRDDGSEDAIDVPVGEDVQVKTALHHAGINNVGFEAEPLPGELTTLNNTRLVSINGVRDRLRVLLVSGQPSVGGRQWLNLLKSDGSVDLINFTILRSPMKPNAIPNRELSLIPFPSQTIFETKLNKFDLVIFDGFSNRLLVPENYLANIAAYVEQGGALLVSNATGAMASELGQSPLARILPVQSNGNLLTGSFVPNISEAGHNHPVTATLGAAQHSPWSPWYRQIDGRIQNDDSEILMTGLQQKPLLVLARVGKGRVAQFLSNQFWLWPREYPTGGPEAEMLRRTAHWLMQEPELDETALTARAEESDGGWKLTIFKRSLKGDSAAVTVTGPDNQPRQVNLAKDVNGAIGATVPVATAGLYRVKDENHEVLVMAGASDAPEFGAMVATDEIVKPLAKATDGGIFWLDDYKDGPEIRRTDKNAGQNGHGWLGLKKNGAYRVIGSKTYPLWPAWAALIIILGIAMFAWRREGD